MQLLTQQIAQIAARPKGSRPALMTHVVLGYPTLKASIEIVKMMAANGASIIELQIPFSDPMADGPTIMAANEAALANGVTPRDCLAAMKELSRSCSVPLLFMSYYNPILRYGVEAFCKDARAAGCEGLIIPDVPLDDPKGELSKPAAASDLAVVPLVSPLTSNERLEQINKRSSCPFVYCISTTGTTGARAELAADLKAYLARAKKKLKRPLAVGFGISSPEQIDSLKGSAEIAIVGSKVIDVVRSTAQSARLQAVAAFVKKMV